MLILSRARPPRPHPYGLFARRSPFTPFFHLRREPSARRSNGPGRFRGPVARALAHRYQRARGSVDPYNRPGARVCATRGGGDLTLREPQQHRNVTGKVTVGGYRCERPRLPPPPLRALRPGTVRASYLSYLATGDAYDGWLVIIMFFVGTQK